MSQKYVENAGKYRVCGEPETPRNLISSWVNVRKLTKSREVSGNPLTECCLLLSLCLGPCKFDKH